MAQKGFYLSPETYGRLMRVLKGADAIGGRSGPVPAAPVFEHEGLAQFIGVNKGGSEIPPYSVVELTDFNEGASDTVREVISVSKFSASPTGKLFAVSDSVSIAVGDRGQFRSGCGIVRVKYDSGSPVLGQIWGPAANKYGIVSGGIGFTIVGVLDTSEKIAVAFMNAPLPGTVAFWNDAGATISAFGVMKISGTYTRSDGTVIIKCIKTDATFASSSAGQAYAVNSGADVADQAEGRCYISGDCLALVKTGTPAKGECWGPAPTDQSLSKDYPGFLTMGYLDATRTLAQVRFDDASLKTIIVKTTGSVSAASSAPGGTPASTTSYNIYVGAAGSRSSISAWSSKPTVYNYGAAITTSHWCAITLVQNEWIITPLEC